MQQIQLGATYADTVSPFEGVAIARAAHLGRSDEVLLQPRRDVDPRWLPIDRLRLVGVDSDLENLIEQTAGRVPE